MRLNKCYILLFALAVMLSSCGKDNYDEPSSILTGSVVYNGEALQVRSTGKPLEGSNELELWQDGYQLYTAIPVYLGQDGSFSVSLFDGTYKMVTRSGAGPWVSAQDTVVVTVKGNTTVNYPVTPFYTISNDNISLSGNTLTATFTITKVTGSLSVETCFLAVNNTAFVDGTAKINRVDKANPGTGQVTLTMTLSESDLAHTTLNARVGVKVAGRDAIYTTIYKIK